MPLAGCAGARHAPGAAAADGVPAALPWELPTGAHPSQRLFRLHYDGPQGEGSLRLVLRLAGPDRYRLTVADRLGRPLYTVDSAGAAGFLLDHREHLACPLAPGLRLDGLPLEPWSLESLPALLLGRLPAVPARRPDPGGEELAYRDAEGRRWTARLAGGELTTWTLWLEGEPAVWWRRSGGESLLSDRRRGLQMSWRETGAEPLAEELAEPGLPEGYPVTECGTGLPESP